MEYRKLGNTGMEVSALSFGASSVGGVFHEVNLDQCVETVRTALDGGINFKEKGVGIINASPTGMGLLTSRGAPPWHPAGNTIIDGCRRAVEYCAAKGVDIVKLAVQYSCSHPDIATTLVSTARPENIRDNITFVQDPRDEGLLSEIRDLLKPVHNFNFTRGRPEHRDPIRGR